MTRTGRLLTEESPLNLDRQWQRNGQLQRERRLYHKQPQSQALVGKQNVLSSLLTCEQMGLDGRGYL